MSNSRPSTSNSRRTRKGDWGRPSPAEGPPTPLTTRSTRQALRGRGFRGSSHQPEPAKSLAVPQKDDEQLQGAGQEVSGHMVFSDALSEATGMGVELVPKTGPLVVQGGEGPAPRPCTSHPPTF